eukprot:4542684-Prymnesium_polylepis.1
MRWDTCLGRPTTQRLHSATRTTARGWADGLQQAHAPFTPAPSISLHSEEYEATRVTSASRRLHHAGRMTTVGIPLLYATLRSAAVGEPRSDPPWRNNAA